MHVAVLEVSIVARMMSILRNLTIGVRPNGVGFTGDLVLFSPPGNSLQLFVSLVPG